MEDTAYHIIIMAQADQALHHIVLHVKQSFQSETAKSVLSKRLRIEFFYWRIILIYGHDSKTYCFT